jgi:hypothetical protein
VSDAAYWLLQESTIRRNPKARTGRVRVEDRVWTDDAGAFRPFGHTLFWALWGWKHDQARVRQTLAWLRERAVDYVRVLGDVGWPGQEIDSSAPAFPNLLGDFIDACHDQHGMRVEISVWGGSHRDPVAAARKVASVVSDSRQHKVMNLEAANESFQNGPDDTVLAEMVAILKKTGCLTAASSGDSGALNMSGAPTIASVHADRQQGRHGERMVRQMWDHRDHSFGLTHNEPAGPRSSVAECTNPSKLAMLRALGIVCGVGAFVFHNGNGVSGRPDPAHNRQGDLWTVPDVDEMMAATRGIDALLPVPVERWQKTTQHGPDPIGPQPLIADMIWSDPGSDHGCDRCYGAVHPQDGFVTIVSDVVVRVDLRAARGCKVEVWSGVGRKVREATLDAGQVIRLDPDDYIVRGAWR